MRSSTAGRLLGGILPVVLLAGLVVGQNNKGTVSWYEGTSTISDSDTDGALTLQSDGKGTYSSFTQRKDQVQSTIQIGSGDWSLNTYGSTSRALRLTLNSRGTPTGPTGSFMLPVRMLTCWDSPQQPSPANLLELGLNHQVECSVRFYFVLSGKEYQLILDSYSNAGTGMATALCTSADSAGRCTRWSIMAGGSSAPLAAELIELGKGGRKTSHGFYDLSIAASVALR